MDVNKSPIVVLGCGHFFNFRRLDESFGMSDVYSVDDYGEFVGLKDFIHSAGEIPSCPKCHRPVRQHLLHRYNLIISRAINYNTSLKLFVSGNEILLKTEAQVLRLEQNIGCARDLIQSKLSGHHNQELSSEVKTYIEKLLQMSFDGSNSIFRTVMESHKSISE